MKCTNEFELYPHNQKAYTALKNMLGSQDRACVIQPTGTGKFVIIARMVQDNPKKRFLLLGTNQYMFDDQMANLADIAPDFRPENLQFMTYAAAMAQAKEEANVPKYDVIVTAAAKATGYSTGTFYCALRNATRTVGGHHFKYADELDEAGKEG